MTMDKDTRREELVKELINKSKYSMVGTEGTICIGLIEIGRCADFILERERKLEERVKVLEDEAKDVWCPFMSPTELREKVVKLESTIAEMESVLKEAKRFKTNMKDTSIDQWKLANEMEYAIDSALRIARGEKSTNKKENV
jgi:hypothetical protein